MTFGERKIPSLTDEEEKAFDYFDKLICLAGVCTNKENSNKSWAAFWTINCSSAAAVMTWTIWHFRNNFDIAAYATHHWVLFVVDVLVLVLFYRNRNHIRFVFEGTKKTFTYDSELIGNFAKYTIRERIVLHRVMGRILTWTAVGIFVEVQIFYFLEELVFKTYRTIYPMYIGLDLDDPIVYSLIVLWEETMVYATTLMALTVFAIAYIGWSHIDLEIEILKFAITHIQEVVDEQIRVTVDPSVKRKTDHELYEVYVHQFAKHHASIINYFNEFAEAMNGITTVAFTTGFCLMVAVGLSTLSDNTGVKLKLIAFLILQTAIIYGWCWFGQYIADKGTELTGAVTDTPWWLMPKKCQSTLFLMLIGSQRRLSLTSPFGQEANKECFMDMASGVYQCISVIFQMRDGM